MAAKRVSVLLPLREQLVGLLAKYRLVPVAKLEFDCLPAVVEMQTAGVRVDRNKLLQLEKRLDGDVSGHRSRLLDWIPEGVNLNDRKIVREVLAENGIDIPNVSQWTLLTLGDHREMADSLLAYRKAQALKSNFVAKYLNTMDSGTSRIFPQWRQLGTSTGRFSCSSPPLQNIPKTGGLRACFVPEKGCSFVFGDFSQIELRVAAELSGDRRMIQAFRDGRDLHRLTASLVTGKTPEQISPEERQAAKALNFGLLFGMSAESLQKEALTEYGVKMTIRQADLFRKNFFEAYPTLFDWIQKRLTSRSCWAETLSGRKRRWEPGDSKPMAWINSPIQGTAADILKKALGLLPGVLRAYRARIVACIHDEIILEVDAAQAGEVSGVLKKTMEDAGAAILTKVPAIAAVRVATSWED
jgi:DNA polymerase I-like protein with 3'-5' exonuclease and polymerase domains